MSSVRKNSFIATIAVMGSRLFGLIREMVFAFFFGAGPVLDAFLAAFRIPNLLRDLFSEGALSTAFVTVFSKKSQTEGDEKAWELASRVLCFLLVFLGLIVVLGVIFAPILVQIVASGFEGEKFELTVLLVRILFPFILFVSMAAVYMGMLNSKGKFFLPQSASTYFNITSIVVGLGLAFVLSPELMKASFQFFLGLQAKPQMPWIETSNAIIGMALGTLIGGLVQWVIQMPEAKKLGFRWKALFQLKDSNLIQVLKLTIPAIIGGAAVQINVMINTNYASYLVDGSISWLNYSFRLMQFPLGVFGVAIAMATTPSIAKLVAENKLEDYKLTMQSSIQLVLLLCLPSALGLIVLAKPIIALIYQYGIFSAQDTLQASNALKAYAVGLIFFAFIKVYQPAFLTFEDAKTPMIISLSSIAINAVVAWLLVFVFKFSHWGLALTTSIVALFNISFLILFFRKKLKGIWNLKMIQECFKIIISSLVALTLAWFVYTHLIIAVGFENLMDRILLVFIPILITLFVYFLVCLLLKVSEVHHLKKIILNKMNRKSF